MNKFYVILLIIVEKTVVFFFLSTKNSLLFNFNFIEEGHSCGRNVYNQICLYYHSFTRLSGVIIYHIFIITLTICLIDKFFIIVIYHTKMKHLMESLIIKF